MKYHPELTSTYFHIVYCFIKRMCRIWNKPTLIFREANDTFFQEQSYSPLQLTVPTDYVEKVHHIKVNYSVLRFQDLTIIHISSRVVNEKI